MGGCPADNMEASVARCLRAGHRGMSGHDGDRAPHPIYEPACGLLYHWTTVRDALIKGNLTILSRTSVALEVK